MLIRGLKFRAREAIWGWIFICPQIIIFRVQSEKLWRLKKTADYLRSLNIWSDHLGSEKIAKHEHPRSKSQGVPHWVWMMISLELGRI